MTSCNYNYDVHGEYTVKCTETFKNSSKKVPFGFEAKKV